MSDFVSKSESFGDEPGVSPEAPYAVKILRLLPQNSRVVIETGGKVVTVEAWAYGIGPLRKTAAVGEGVDPVVLAQHVLKDILLELEGGWLEHRGLKKR